ncbi:MAG: sulfur oxidation c-type cytochrome SoxA [Gammaproteobacteria bacterium]
MATLKTISFNDLMRAVAAKLKGVVLIALMLACLPLASSAPAGPARDQIKLRQHYLKLFPDVEFDDHANGVYAIDPVARESWRAIEEFPPYEEAVEQGKELFNTPFPKTGHTYADCFANRGIGIAQHYPMWSRERGEVITLSEAVNDCRRKNRESPLDAERGEITRLLAYLSYTSRGKRIDIVVPEEDPRALIAYQQGRDFYYQRRGRLNFACATCHVQNAGKRLRSEILSPSLGHTAGWPTYRLKWGEMGTLHRRFRECLVQIRAEPPPAQSLVLRNLEYFLRVMGNGIPISGPSTRK